MATPIPGKMVSSTYSPAQKRRMDKLIGFKNSTGDDLDIQITSCLYHLGKNDVAQATKILEEIRKLMEASNSKVYYKTERDYHGNFNQKINWLEKRKSIQSRHIANIERKFKSYKALLSFDDGFVTYDPTDASISLQNIPILGSQDSADLPVKPKMSQCSRNPRDLYPGELFLSEFNY